MRLTRRLLATASSTSKQTKKISPHTPPSPQYKQLLQPRSQWDVIYSAASCVHSVLFDKSKRESLVSMVDKGIIQPNVLGQADFGSALMLALHHDLTSDLFRERGGEFCVEEFLEGVEPALESFQEVLYSIDREKMAGLKNQLKALQSSENSGKQEPESDSASQNSVDTSNIEKILEEQDDWISAGDQDPSSLLGQLRNMTSPYLLYACEKQFSGSVLFCYANMLPRMEYVPESGQITNIALLSARAGEVAPPIKESNDQKEDHVMSDDSFSSGIEKEYPVAAQMEVIYSISQRFKKRRIDYDDDLSSETENEEHEIESNWVAVLETHLSSGSGFGGSVGNNLLRWKLVQNRPAWEFPRGFVNI